MGKQGPCYHCGVTSTPLWRNGPPEKPILCNACGSRWRTKGTLANYTPLHARTDVEDYEDYRASRLKTVSNKNKETKVLKRKPYYDNYEVGTYSSPDYNQGLRRGLDEDTSNRSSSGSAISNSESCAQFGDASELTGPAQPVVWDSMVPSRKRTCVTRAKPSSVEKLTKDLFTILHEQQQSSYFSGSSEEDLLFESDKPMVSVEFGHGSILMRHPNATPREEESEASSLSVENKPYTANEAYSPLTTFSVHNDRKGVNFSTPGMEKMKKPSYQSVDQEQTKRDKNQLERLQLLGHHNSPLHFIDLKEVLNFGEFVNQLTNDERQQLLKYLPSIDASGAPESLRSMFESPQLEENMCSFQKLLAEGLFDNTLAGVKEFDCKALKVSVLCNSTKSKWIEQYSLLKNKTKSGSSASETAGELNAATGHSVNVKRSRDVQNARFPGAKTIVKSPKRVITTKASYEHREVMNHDGSCFSPKSLFAPPPDNSSLVLDSFTSAESCDQDLLVDVPSNGSFAQAELLHPSSSFGAPASTSSSSGYPHFLRS